MIRTQQELSNEIDMLNGNINRMCVCKSYKELSHNFLYAQERLREIYIYNIDRLNNAERKED